MSDYFYSLSFLLQPIVRPKYINWPNLNKLRVKLANEENQ